MDWPVLETPRLTLRAPCETDLPQMPGVFHDPEVYAYTNNIPHPYGPEEATRCLGRYQHLAREGAALTLFPELRETGEMIGLVVLALSSGRDRAVLGYAIGRTWWGAGYATEASNAMVAYGFGTLGLATVSAQAMVRNPASVRVLRKLGMRSTGLEARACQKDGEWFDAESFEISAAEWSTRDTGR